MQHARAVAHTGTVVACQVCGADAPGREVVTTERMHGLGGEFHYVECGACGSLQISSVPDDLGRYYPRDYYSYRRPGRLARARDAVKRSWLRASVGRPALLGRAIRARRGPAPSARWLTLLDGDLRGRSVLDVGCGSGTFLRSLAGLDLELVGVDPFLPDGVDAGPGIRLERSEIYEVDRTFDVVHAHHSLEHQWDWPRLLTKVASVVAPGGLAVVSLPVVPNPVFDRFGEAWFGLDPPRHLVIPSRDGLIAAMERSGLSLVARYDESFAGDYLASGAYAAGVDAVTFQGTRDERRAAARDATADVASGRASAGTFVFRRDGA